MLRPQDILVVLRLLLSAEGKRETLQELSVELGLSASQVHAAIRRAAQSRLVDELSREVNRSNLKEWLVHGVKYWMPPQFTTPSRGVPTSIAAPPLNEQFAQGNDLLPVWPHPEGAMSGLGLMPIHPAVPRAAMQNTELHQWLALVDAVRAGRGRERLLAIRELERRLG